MERTKEQIGIRDTAVGEPIASALSRWRPGLTIAICIVLAAIVWVVFSQTLGYDFVNYDDNEYVYENPHIIAGLAPSGIAWALRTPYANNWHPLTAVSQMLDCQFYGLRPWGHHLTNVLLHTAAAIFLFLALLRMSDALWPSALVAALFSIHPLRVESVAWIAERKDVLSGMFFMLILLAYARFVRSERPSPAGYTLMVALFALGLMCKPTLVTLPFVLLLLDYWPLRRFNLLGPRQRWSYLVLEKVPFFLLSAASSAVTLIAQRNLMVPVQRLNWAQRLGNAGVVYVIYLYQTIFPKGLAVIYPYPRDGVNVIGACLAFLFLAVVSALFFFWRKRYPYLLVGWLWFLGMLVPMLGLIQVGSQRHADRYTYLPQIGLFLLIIWGVARLVAKWHVPRSVAALGAAVVLGAFGAISYAQTSFWKNSEVLWSNTLANTVDNGIAENNLGTALAQQQRFDEALGHFENALRIYPEHTEANCNLAFLLARQGKDSEAIPYYETALQNRSEFPGAHYNLGVSLAKIGRGEEAIEQFETTLRLKPEAVEARYNLAIQLLQLGRRDEAVAQLREALRIKPGDPQVREQLRALGLSE